MNKIVIGYDGTAQAEDALALGRALSETLAATPIVVAAVPWPPSAILREELQQEAEQKREEFQPTVDRWLAGLGAEFRCEVSRSAAEELIAVGQREHAAAIVVGSSHRGAVGRVALGSVGASLIHGAPSAVAVAPVGLAAAKPRLGSIAVAFDGSPEAWAALETGIGFAERMHARLTVLTVSELPKYGLGEAWSVVSAAEVIEAEKRQKERILELGLGRCPAELAAEGRFLTGSAGRLLAEASGEFDIMVLGSRGHGPLGRTLLGSVSTQVIHSAQCPVLVLPRAAGVDPLRVGSSHPTLAGVVAR